MRRPSFLRTASLATLAATFGTLSCNTPSPQPIPSCEHTLTQDHTPHHLIERHRPELEDLALRAQKDNIERGGVIIANRNGTRFIELYNVFRDGPSLIERYASGAHDLYSTLDELITSAATVRTNCAPSTSAHNHARATEFRNALAALRNPAVDRDTFAAQLRIIYAELALHTTYRKHPEELLLAEQQGTVLFHVHTHNDPAKRETPPDHDPLAPSRQDLLLSKTQHGIVTGINAAGEHRIYHSFGGTYRLIEPLTTITLR
ncbi:hypothetical protein C4580_04830 [Candidatus Woesearchaeota archaeon]|nr:MAG: hypothetical protein C4580_04830 [Candidatus Woesearchaeota archaeon]